MKNKTGVPPRLPSLTACAALGLSTLLAACATGRGAAAGDGPDPSLPTLPHEKYQLDNGLTVILHHDARLPLVAVSIWYDVGALHEKPKKSGFAHLFEHMMFQASPHVGEDAFFRTLQEIGGTKINGTTSYDRTNYFETVPSTELETVLWLESDRMGFLLSSLTKESLDNQIEVVKNERRQSVENQPYGLMDEVVNQTLYPAPHPYNGNVIGSMEDIASATLADVQDFFRTYYTPANATLTIAGAFDPEGVKGLVEKYFGSIKGRPKPPPVKIAAAPIAEPLRIDFDETVANLPKVSVVWMGPSAFEEDTAALDLLSHVISGTRSARLDKRVSFDDLIAQSVTCYFQEHASGGQFQIDVVVRPGRTLDEAVTAIDEVLADLQKNPPTKAELARALDARETRVLWGLQELGGFSGRAEQLQTYQHYLGDPAKLAWDLERFREVKVDDLVRVMKQWVGANRLVVRATPKAAEEGAQE